MHKHIPNRRVSLREDSWLSPYAEMLRNRARQIDRLRAELPAAGQSLEDFASGHEYFGLHRRDGGNWVFREWAPNASQVVVFGDFCDWCPEGGISCCRLAHGIWEAEIPQTKLKHGDYYRLQVNWEGGGGERLPSYARRVVQDEETKIFSAQVWSPEKEFCWDAPAPENREAPLIYEAHVGMAQEEEKVGSYREFETEILPRIAAAGYNTIQLMGIMEHPYYGSFGYHVANFFAVSSRFGPPEDFKSLVNAAHRRGLRVIIDLVHSHAVRNEVEGLGRFDGTSYQYFHEGSRGYHQAWDSYCFNYAKPEVLHFLLSNCRFWLDEYHLDGFRFDGITSMLYRDHGLGAAFTNYDRYFDGNVDPDAIAYLGLANSLIHTLHPHAITIAEDVSGLPGLGADVAEGGCGFDYRLAMGVTDYWFKLLDIADEKWSMGGMWHELSNRRRDERTISYVECHDQAIVGGQTMIFTLIGDETYHSMHCGSESLMVKRGIALHKLARLATLATAGNGYLNFMGNEFGHPEWIDFPREGNNWSCHHARRLWSLAENQDLRYHHLANFDREMLALASKFQILNRANPVYLETNDEEKILAFERGGLFFFFNFHPGNSYSDREFQVLPGEYELLLDSDAREFGGHERVVPAQHYHSRKKGSGKEASNVISLYLPQRTALVLRRISGGDALVP